MALNLFTLPADRPFLDAIAQGWLARAGPDPQAVSRGLILLPTRRAARALVEAFLRAAGGRPLLLPRITALGALDEAPLALAGALDLPPAVEEMQRLAALTRLILAAGVPTADQAWRLAVELAALMDEADRAGIDLRAALPGAADERFAEHWQRTLDFLRIVTRAWPDWLTANGMMNPAARQVALLHAQAEAWERAPPADPVLVAGTTAGIPAVARLLSVVARLPQGQVVLPALDRAMPDEAWAAIEESHPQAGLARLLAALEATRGDVRPWPPGASEPPASRRFATLSLALLPAGALSTWQARHETDLAGVSRLHCADQQHEAEAIALILRDTLETPGATAALVTPDRGLAIRVAAALGRFGVIADDSAGEPLTQTPPAVFLRLLARAVAEGLAPVPLLALLKHPLAAAGLAPPACRSLARTLETACLRGARPASGLAGLRQAVEGARDQALTDFLGKLERALEPALRAAAAALGPAEALATLIAAAERLAATDAGDGPGRLWSGEEGEALADRLTRVLAVLPELPDLPRGSLPDLLDAILDGAVVRSRRALRGRTGAEHPRIFIWGLLEARLQSVDRLVLGGLTEGVWPPQTDPGPWLSRPMRRQIGLPSPEERVGQAAHDFLATACAAPEVVLSAPARRDGALAVPARWLTRIEAFLAGQGLPGLPAHPAAAWALRLDQPAGGPRPVPPPAPCPPVALRPRRLSVTEIETWRRDPYAIYARHILRLVRLRPLDEDTDNLDFGTIVHGALARFIAETPDQLPPDPAARLRALMQAEARAARLRPALLAWWEPRLLRIADWIAERERARQPGTTRHAEVSGRKIIRRPGGPFTLTGRADRIERHADGSLTIIDYKTGTLPPARDVREGWAPQLPLEAMMAADGGFGAALHGAARSLLYWRLTGADPAGEVSDPFGGSDAGLPVTLSALTRRLDALIDAFDAPDTPYPAQPDPARAPRFSDYAQLERVGEWSVMDPAREEEG